MKNPFSKVSNETLGRIGIWGCIVGAVVGTVTDIVAKVRHDKRDAKLYATLQLKADSVDVETLDKFKTDETYE